MRSSAWGSRVGGEPRDEFPGEITALSDIGPVYGWHTGWKRSTAEARQLEGLPREARSYLDRIESLVESRITWVSVGTRRDQIIEVHPESGVGSAEPPASGSAREALPGSRFPTASAGK